MCHNYCLRRNGSCKHKSHHSLGGNEVYGEEHVSLWKCWLVVSLGWASMQQAELLKKLPNTYNGLHYILLWSCPVIIDFFGLYQTFFGSSQLITWFSPYLVACTGFLILDLQVGRAHLYLLLPIFFSSTTKAKLMSFAGCFLEVTVSYE